MIVALGAGQALAQSLAATYEPGSDEIEVTYSGAGATTGNLYAQGEVASTFTLTNGPTGVTVTGTSLPTTRAEAESAKFTLTLSGPLESTDDASGTRVELAYTATPANRLIELGATAADDAPVATISSAPMTEKDIPPMLPATLEDMEFTFVMGKAVDEEALPAATGGNPGSDATLMYRLGSQSDPIPGVTFNTTTRKFMGTPTELGTYPVFYEVTDGNEALNTAATPADTVLSATVDDEDVVKLTIHVVEDDTIDPGTGMYGRVTMTKLTGVTEKTIDGVKRNHVGEGSTGVMLEVTVQWLVSELRTIYGSATKLTDDDADLTVGIVSDSTMTTPWASMIDDQQDVHFPQSSVVAGVIQSTVKVKYPAKPPTTADDDSTRTATGKIRVYILEDDFEAENEVFRIDVLSSNDVDVDARGSRPYTSTMVTVIEDDETQTVTLSGSKRVMEDAGKAEYTVVAKPERYDLPLEISWTWSASRTAQWSAAASTRSATPARR